MILARPRRVLVKLILVIFTASLFEGVSLFWPTKLDSAGDLTSASATLANSRLSFYGKLNSAHTAGDTTIALDTTGNADNNTYHLFPQDGVSVGPNGGMTVGSIIDSSNFALSAGLTVAASDQDPIYSTQSGALTITFTITNDIPANGYVRVLIPDAASNQNDGAPDTGTLAANGFDLNGMATTDIATTGGTGCTWSTETLTAGTGSSHKYKVLTTTACTAGAITVTFDGSTKDLVNPAPESSHAQGTADIYTIDVDTYDGDPDSGGQLIDTVDIKVAPIEAVLVSATVEETLSFSIAAVSSGETPCGNAADVTTTAYSIPWGSLSTADSFSEAAQKLTVATNADGGYTVKIDQNDQMGKNGGVCTGNPTDPTTTNCIPDNPGDGTLDYNASDDCDTAATNGMCFSQQSAAGSPTLAVAYNVQTNSCDSSPTYCARVPADIETVESAQTIFSYTTPVSSDQVYVCYRISVDATQPAGYYFNKVKYTATATF